MSRKNKISIAVCLISSKPDISVKGSKKLQYLGQSPIFRCRLKEANFHFFRLKVVLFLLPIKSLFGKNIQLNFKMQPFSLLFLGDQRRGARSNKNSIFHQVIIKCRKIGKNMFLKIKKIREIF